MSGGAIHIAMASDERFAMHLNVAAASILENSDKAKPLCIHVIHDGLSDAAMLKFESLKSIRPFEPDWLKISHEDFKEFKIPRNLSVMTNVRLKLPNLLPSVPRLIYLDCDIVVLDGIEKLWGFDLRGKAAGAVPDYGIKTRKIERIGCQGRSYFNAGVLLLDLDKLRAEDSVKGCVEAMQCPFKPKNDQEILNIVLRGDWAELPLRWDVQAPVTPAEAKANGYGDIASVEAAIADPAIIHFTSYKPSSHLFDGVGGELYFKYLAMTAYSSYKVNDKTWRNIIVRSSPKSFRTRIRHLLDRVAPKK